MKTGFLNLLDAREIGEHEGRSVWKLNAPLVFTLNQCVSIEVPAGFETDFASVPRLPLIWWLWGDRAHREAVMHDYMYRTDAKTVQGKEISKEDADWYFRQAMVIQGVSWEIYQPMYLGVRLFGGPSYRRMAVMDHFQISSVTVGAGGV